MKKTSIIKQLFIIAVMLLCSGAYAQIRSYVGIVREQYYPGLVDFLNNYKDELNRTGYSSYIKYIDAYLEGGFGSGFVYIGEDGTNYIITNRHVVSQADTATIEFENEDGTYTKYEGLVVAATDDDIDVAVLKFKDGSRPFKKGLAFTAEPVTDGSDVWSAGFPGLGSDPVWQLGRGSVTNSRTRIKELLDPSISTLIQHSAEIDSGNSGGPLLIKDKSAAGFSVAGINTWKALNRQNTNYAIPAAVIKDMIKRASKPVEPHTAVSQRAEKYFNAIKNTENDFTSIASFISYDSASKTGKKDFENILRSAPSAVRNVIVSEFASSPIEGLRMACAYQMWLKFSAKDSDSTEYTPKPPIEEGSMYTVSASDKGEENIISTTWECEHGLWRLSSASYTKASKGNEKKARSESMGKAVKQDVSFEFRGLDTPDTLRFTLGYDSNSTPVDNSFNFALSIWGLWDGFGGLSVSYCPQRFEGDKYKLLGLDAMFRLPMDFTAVNIAPVVKAGFGFSPFESDLTLMTGSYGFGLEALKVSDTGFNTGMGVCWTKKGFVLSGADLDEDYDLNCSSLQVYLFISY